jgi:type I restriction enzyme M protein
VEGGKSAPEEIVRQLWVYKLIHQYGYHPDEIGLEKSVQFGTEVGAKAADIIVYTDATKETPKIIVECKKADKAADRFLQRDRLGAQRYHHGQ